MTAFTDFQHSIASAQSLTAMYAELRKYRKLGQRGRLAPPHEDILWLPRSAVVASLSSLDAYVHAILYERIPYVLKGNSIPDSLCDAMAKVVPIKNTNSFREALPTISATNVHEELIKRLNAETLTFLSYQAPNKICSAYDMIGHPNIFDEVSAIWPGPRTTPDDIKRLLENFVRRRNQIAHEGDREQNGEVRHMQPEYANRCADFIQNLVSRLNRVVYG